MKDEYFEVKRISNSSLSWFKKSPKYFKLRVDNELKDEDSKSMRWGNLVHTFLLEPDIFEEKYKVFNYEKPVSEQQIKFCTAVAAGGAELLDIYKDTYKTKGKDEKLLKIATDLVDKYKPYIDFLKLQNSDQIIISTHQFEQLEEVKKAAQNHLKANELLFETEGLNELAVYWTYKDEMNEIESLECKSKIDRVIIDKENKSITLVDLKTTYDISNFADSVEKYGYARQLAFYWIALGSYFETEMLGEDFDEYDKYTYIVAIDSDLSLREVKVFNISEKLLNTGLEEIQNTMPELNWHYKNDKWDHSLSYYTNNGVDTL